MSALPMGQTSQIVDIVSIEIPWPPKILSPNARPHWASKADAKKRYRRTAMIVAAGARIEVGRAVRVGEQIFVRLSFHPPTRREHDADNLIAAMKSGLDGIADGIGVDDALFRLLPITVCDPVKGGRVIVTLARGI